MTRTPVPLGKLHLYTLQQEAALWSAMDEADKPSTDDMIRDQCAYIVHKSKTYNPHANPHCLRKDK